MCVLFWFLNSCPAFFGGFIKLKFSLLSHSRSFCPITCHSCHLSFLNFSLLSSIVFVAHSLTLLSHINRLLSLVFPHLSFITSHSSLIYRHTVLVTHRMSQRLSSVSISGPSWIATVYKAAKKRTRGSLQINFYLAVNPQSKT